MFGRRAAAAADNRESEIAHESREVFGQLVRFQRIDRDALAIFRNARVRLATERERRALGERSQRIDHLARAGRAVEPHHVDAGGGQERRGSERLGTEQHPAGRVQSDLRDDRDRAADIGHRLARAEDLRPQLEQILRGLGDDAVDPSAQQTLRLLAEDLDQFRRSDAAEIGIGAGRKKSARPERTRDVPRPAVGALGFVGLGAGDARGGFVHLVNFRAEIELVELVRLDDVAADLEVPAVYSRDDVRPRQREDFIAALPPVEVLDRQLPGELHPLERGAHGAVENDDSAGDRIDNVLLRHTRARTLPRVASCYGARRDGCEDAGDRRGAARGAGPRAARVASGRDRARAGRGVQGAAGDTRQGDRAGPRAAAEDAAGSRGPARGGGSEDRRSLETASAEPTGARARRREDPGGAAAGGAGRIAGRDR